MNIRLNRLKEAKVLVVGDLMLDTYHIGSVKRISPEAPVPVVQVKRSYSVLGGAANVARNLIGLGASPIIVGVVGQDTNGAVVREMCDELEIDSTIGTSSAPTITKTRIIGNDQQVVRIDFEQDDSSLSEELESTLIAAIEQKIEQCDVVVISDYGKGFCSEKLCQATIAKATSLQKCVVVDPKGTAWHKYSGAAIVTPNLKELADVAACSVSNDDKQIEEVAKAVTEQHSLESLLVTRSERGMSYISQSERVVIPTQAREVFDVSGAGDTVVATLAAAIAAGFTINDSIYLANKAAGVVVGKMGTSPILFDELEGEIAEQSPLSDKIVASESLEALIAQLRESNKKIVFTNGCFDILHRGHVTYLENTKSHGDILILGLNSDSSVKRLKGEGRPINDEQSRATVMAALSSVDYVVIFDEDTPLELIRTIRPDVLAKGGDYSIEGIVGREYATETVVIPFVDGFSTTKTISKIAENE